VYPNIAPSKPRPVSSRVHELEQLLDTQLVETPRGAVGTVRGLIMARLDRMPRVGDEVTPADWTLRVERLKGRRVAFVRLHRRPRDRRAPSAEAKPAA
jgi:CBS domain containing-hemolysin-like protein